MLSIITPVLNGEKYLEWNILSIKALDIPFEHIIVDGGSTDGTLEIIRRYPHVRLLQQSGALGMYDAVHQGFMIARGDVLGYVNADDQVLVAGMKAMVERLSSDPSLDFVYSNGYFLFADKGLYVPVYGKRGFRYFLLNNIMPFLQPATLYRKSRYLESGGFRYEQFRLIGDLDLFQRFALLEGFRARYLPVFSTVFLRRRDSLLYSNMDKLAAEESRLEVRYRIRLITRVLFQGAKLFSFFLTVIHFLTRRNGRTTAAGTRAG